MPSPLARHSSKHEKGCSAIERRERTSRHEAEINGRESIDVFGRIYEHKLSPGSQSPYGARYGRINIQIFEFLSRPLAAQVMCKKYLP
ncbi:hypothetical protein K7X08_001467 [Anisodus acutangulus]|uniref:Uncharacterized protein n=1 Tax=Anisodus acutangulus TaxID=402998 RepID=A0A9Q1MNR2_9SOLA|nr:hypothetical protein K7X08_001467 [Anisodus acutangulus]